MVFLPFHVSLYIFPLLCLRDRIERRAHVGVHETKRKRYVTTTTRVARRDGGRGKGEDAAGRGSRGRWKNFLNSRQNAKSSPRPCIRSDGRRDGMGRLGGGTGGKGEREREKGGLAERVVAGSDH